ncbi:MAG: hypothetical protein M3R55_12525 [Acidobacteriota bacterium]|nr:hypothetical protein [Acidobacteriota bacterium]
MLMIYGTATCLSGSGGSAGAVATSSATLAVELDATAAPDVWRVSMPGQSLTGEIALVNGQVQGWLRGSASADGVRLSTTGAVSDALGFESGARENNAYAGPVLVGTPRYEGVGAASGSYTTCAANGFTLKRA